MEIDVHFPLLEVKKTESLLLGFAAVAVVALTVAAADVRVK